MITSDWQLRRRKENSELGLSGKASWKRGHLTNRWDSVLPSQAFQVKRTVRKKHRSRMNTTGQSEPQGSKEKWK